MAQDQPQSKDLGKDASSALVRWPFAVCEPDSQCVICRTGDRPRVLGGPCAVGTVEKGQEKYFAQGLA